MWCLLHLIFVIIVINFCIVHGHDFDFKKDLDKLQEAGLLDEADNTFFRERKSSFGVPNYADYDFIIVGSGPAGSVLANRLSENPAWNILLLEAGKPENVFTDIPGLCAMFQLTDYNWGYKMEKQEGACLGMINQQCLWPRGKALGGSSVINYMIYTRGNHYDFQRWSELGLDGWTWNDVLPYYLKSERARLADGEPGYHNYNGRLSVEDVPNRTPLVHAFVKSGNETGHEILDYNGHSQYGFSYVQGTIRSGKRCSAAKAFLGPKTQQRRNLLILPFSRVTKVLIDRDTNTAYGIEYLRNRRKYTAYAKKEVILSAGAFASPQLLMLSGIGPRQHLEELKIPVVKDLPVGQFMQDHLTFVGLTFLVNETDVSYTYDKAITKQVFLDYVFNHNGPLTTLGGVEGLGYIRTPFSAFEWPDYPDIELIFVGGSITSDAGTIFRQGFNINQSLYDAVYRKIDNKDCWSIIPMLLHPRSKGYLKLKSTNIFHHPKLYGNYYTDPEGNDIKSMVSAIKTIIELSKTDAFQKYGSRLHDVPLPNCAHLGFGTDEYWECALRTFSPSLHHQVGTCRMGLKDDPMAVVDERLRVHGVKKLRVADTSVIPFSISAHTNAPSFMIGERLADFLKIEYGPK